MSRFRHSLSLILTATLYISFAFVYIYFIDIKKPITRKKLNRIKISIIEPKPIVHTIIPKKLIKKPIKKLKIKKKRKHKLRHKQKKIIKKTKIVKRRVRKKIKHKLKIKPRIKPPIPTPEYIVEKNYITKPQIVIEKQIYTPSPKIKKKIVKKIPVDNLNNKKKRFLKELRESIYANKHYPLKAKRRRLEGSVHLVFDIGTNGEAMNIRTSNSSSILQRAVRRSLKKSFPVSIPHSLKSKFPMKNISINIDFRLR